MTSLPQLKEKRTALKSDIKEARTKRAAQARKIAALRQQLKDATAQIAQAKASALPKPTVQVRANVVNQSSRGGVKPAIIVLHSTESSNQPGLQDLSSLVAWFNNPKAQASSHLVVDAEGNTARCVPDAQKAWTEAAFNPQGLSIEMIGRAAQTEWPEAQVLKVAAHVRLWAKTYGIPLVHSTAHGVCFHADLGAAGGGHHDPGAAFPLGRVLALAGA